MAEKLHEAALEYHRYPKPGKLEIRATKPLANQLDLSLAYSPGVAAACKEIEKDPLNVAHYTSRSNLVAVISNGTAVLGLGAIGALASKPVMEGKAVLFKEFANVDVFDIEIEERDPEKFIETVASMEPSFGGINLEDIKAPECFIIEKALKERMNIPVFHDDQHGTAIVVCAAIINGLRVVDKAIEEVKVVTSGAGAAALACLDLLVDLGLKRENVTVCDGTGVIYQGRVERMDPYKAKYAKETPHRTLEQALQDADVLLGLSAAGVVEPQWLLKMSDRPLVFTLANPVPEIMPELTREARPDAIIATGRSDYPNQVNNVLCFPFLFRGALDVGATEINSQMKMACVNAIAEMARKEPSDIVRSAYGGSKLQFGPDYLIPKPFDKRLLEIVPVAVAQAAMDSGVATRPITDMDAYRIALQTQVFRTTMTMKPVFEQVRDLRLKVVYAEGEDERVLQVIQQVMQQRIAEPWLVGRRSVIEQKIEELGMHIKVDEDFFLVDPTDPKTIEQFGDSCYQRLQRKGFPPQEANKLLQQNSTVLAAAMLQSGYVDAMLCGVTGRYRQHLEQIQSIIGVEEGVKQLTSMSGLVMTSGTLFFADTYVQDDPDAEALAEITRLSCDEVRRFGIEPKVAMLSHSNFGAIASSSARKMRDALTIIQNNYPDIEVDGEMHADLALLEPLRRKYLPESKLSGAANLLIMPNQDAANIAFNLLKTVGEGTAIGPLLLGAAKAAHIVTPGITVRGLLNMTALAAVHAVHRDEV